jgi:cold shock CspA family protein
LKLYGEIINEQEGRGFIETVKEEENTGSKIYITFHTIQSRRISQPPQ